MTDRARSVKSALLRMGPDTGDEDLTTIELEGARAARPAWAYGSCI